MPQMARTKRPTSEERRIRDAVKAVAVAHEQLAKILRSKWLGHKTRAEIMCSTRSLLARVHALLAELGPIGAEIFKTQVTIRPYQQLTKQTDNIHADRKEG